jgi:sugar lactone lactonase YvrE
MNHRFQLTGLALLLLCISPGVAAQDLGDPACPRLMLISSWTGNNVRIHDACNGQFIRNLDTHGYLAGPQAIALDPEGRLVVVSEGNGRLVRYHRDTLTYDQVIAGDRPETPNTEPSPVSSPTGLVIAADGRMFVGSYDGHVVSHVDPATGQAVATLVDNSRSGILGPDTGMLLDGQRLLVPGFDSSTVVEADIDVPNSDRILVSDGSGGLNRPRTVLQKPDGNLLVTSWRGNDILEFNGQTGAFIGAAIPGIERPTGMAFESAEVLLVASDRSNDIRRFRLSDGALIDTLATSVPGPTFILLLDKQTPALALNRAFWVVGVGVVDGNRIEVDELTMTTGGAFGPNLEPEDIERVSWGNLTFEFDSCDGGSVSWETTDGHFRNGSYPIIRLAGDPLGAECREAGFEQIGHRLWMNGLWYGGADRDGEGFSVNIIDNGLAVVAWYTYQPAATP